MKARAYNGVETWRGLPFSTVQQSQLCGIESERPLSIVPDITFVRESLPEESKASPMPVE